ncbi:MAG TPA: response regulator [Polyangia bacterium]|nr:response regulator [Polyangia bacterium]
MATRTVVLDDDEDVLDALASLLAALGAPATAVRSVAELTAHRHDVLAADLVILDLNLGRDLPSGLDALAWLKDQRFAGRIVFLTGHGAGDPLIARACAVGGVPLLRKPIGLDELRALVAG